MDDVFRKYFARWWSTFNKELNNAPVEMDRSVALGCGLGHVNAQESGTSKYGQLASQHQVRINGQENPELVPYALRMKLFFFGYSRPERAYQAELKGALSTADAAVLESFAATHGEMVNQSEQEKAVAFGKISEQAEAMSGIELAYAFQSIYEGAQEKLAARYRQALGQLSPEGRNVIERFAYERIRPSSVRTDDVAIASADPDLYKQEVIDARDYEKAHPPSDPTQTVPGKTTLKARSAPAAAQSVEGSSPSIRFTNP